MIPFRNSMISSCWKKSLLVHRLVLLRDVIGTNSGIFISKSRRLLNFSVSRRPNGRLFPKISLGIFGGRLIVWIAVVELWTYCLVWHIKIVLLEKKAFFGLDKAIKSPLQHMMLPIYYYYICSNILGFFCNKTLTRKYK